jgi:hypothetical protein
VWYFLQLLGAACLIIVVLTYIFEALHLFPYGLGFPYGIVHYLDIWSAVLGLTLFAVGFLRYALTKRHT